MSVSASSLPARTIIKQPIRVFSLTSCLVKSSKGPVTSSNVGHYNDDRREQYNSTSLVQAAVIKETGLMTQIAFVRIRISLEEIEK